MFSSRFDAGLAANPLSQAVFDRNTQRLPLLDLTETNPTRAGFTYEDAAILGALASAGALRYEPDPKGARRAREAVAAYYGERGGEVDPEAVVLTASTSEAYALAFKLLLDPGDTVLVPRPSYPLFEHLAALEGVRAESYPLRYAQTSGWRVDPESLETLHASRPGALVAVSPNNPTGSYLKPEELSRLARWCRERDAALVVDEVFNDYPARGFNESPAEAATGTEVLTLVLSGLSKVAALPQLKLGWIVVAGPETVRREALRRLEFIADAYLSVSAPVQHAAPRLLELRHGIQSQIRERVEANEAVLRRELERDGGGVHVRRREGGWYAVLDLPPGLTDEALVLSLVSEDGVLVHPGFFYDFQEEEVLVLSLLTASDVFTRGTSILGDRIRRGP